MKQLPICLFLLVTAANAQNVVATDSSNHEIQIVPHPTSVTFVVGDRNHLQDAAVDTAVAKGGGHVIGSAAAHAIPVPFVGSMIADAAVGGMLKALHKQKAIVGSNLAFLQGLLSGTAIPKGALTFTVPGYSMQGATPVLLRIRSSAIYGARIVRGVRLSAGVTSGIVDTASAKILSVDQDLIPCQKEVRDEGLVLIPDSLLEGGEYAIALVPEQSERMPVSAAILWDFQIY